MTHALRLDARSNRADRTAVLLPRSRYTVVGKLRASGRAELSICLPRGAHRVDDVVLVKTFAPGVLKRTSSDLPAELDLASRLHHDNIIRTLGCGSDDGKDFVVTEYLEGITLHRLLEWLNARGEKLADAAVARLLLGVFSAVEHATRCAVTPEARALIHQVVAAEDVFVTCKGDVKLLGFKPASRSDAAADPVFKRAAVDALLSTQRSSELGLVLARVGARLSPSSVLGLWQIARALESWQAESLGSDGRSELAAMMAQLLPEGRATRRAHLEAACARVRRLQLAQEEPAYSPSTTSPNAIAPNGMPSGAGPNAEPAEEAPPVSGFRATGANVAIVQPTLDAEGPGMDLALSPLPPSVRDEAGYADASLALRVESSLPVFVEVSPRPTASHHPLAMDIPAGEAAGMRLPWLAVAIAAGMASAFGVHHVLRTPTPAPMTAMATQTAMAPGSTGAPGAAAAPLVAPTVAPATVAPATVAPATVAPVAVERVESAPVGASAPAIELAAAPSQQAGLRGAAGRWTLPGGERRPSVERASADRASVMPEMARGYLTLDTTPWSMVSLAGVALGQTPLVKVELPAGQHVLELTNPELGISSSVVVDVVAGLTMVRRIGLERPVQAAAAP